MTTQILWLALQGLEWKPNGIGLRHHHSMNGKSTVSPWAAQTDMLA